MVTNVEYDHHCIYHFLMSAAVHGVSHKNLIALIYRQNRKPTRLHILVRQVLHSA